jgi:hypothetical protein
LEAVHGRQHDVEDDRVVPADARHRQAGPAVMGEVDRVPLGRQPGGDHLGQPLFVFHHQQTHVPKLDTANLKPT